MALNEAYCVCNEPGDIRDITTLLYCCFLLFNCKLILIWHYLIGIKRHRTKSRPKAIQKPKSSIYICQCRCSKPKSSSKEVVTDFMKAFDKIDRTTTISNLIVPGVRLALISWIADFLCWRQQCVRYQSTMSDWSEIHARRRSSGNAPRSDDIPSDDK